jgi:hypothetical protein
MSFRVKELTHREQAWIHYRFNRRHALSCVCIQKSIQCTFDEFMDFLYTHQVSVWIREGITLVCVKIGSNKPTILNLDEIERVLSRLRSQ